ncbi:MAG: stage III sporulation protein AC [Oscillospiraceae bacterium]|nr:stage III sporulation protein AC [Oscillospiraceae bacterium]
MEVGLILKIAGIGLIVAVAYSVLSRSGREEQAALVSLAGVVIVLFMIISEIDRLFTSVKDIFGL